MDLAHENGLGRSTVLPNRRGFHRGRPWLDTADFGDESPGNLRVDYVLPSRGMKTGRSGVFWPVPGTRLDYLNDASDHHLVWVDVRP